MNLDFVREAARKIQEADALVIAAGAGMGVDSGLPDFRGNEGFWKAYPVVARLGLSFPQMANPEWFKKDPALAWAFYGHRLNLYRKVTPHAGFSTLLKWAAKKPGGFFVFTSNVDGHFQKTGFSPEQIFECHGSIHHIQCSDGCTHSIWDAENVRVDEAVFRAEKPLPSCRHCGGMARPNVMMFDDYSWISDRSDEQQRRFGRWLQALRNKSSTLVILEFGAGTAIPSVRHNSERLLDQFEATLIRVNLREAGVPDGHYGLAIGALKGIELLEENMEA